MKIIFQIDGGLGKSIMATSVCKAIKAQYPSDELIVITGYPAVFFCNPYVNKVLAPNDQLYFYRDQIQGQRVKMLLHNPYLQTEFIAGDQHLIKIWCEMFGIKYNGEQPELFITQREKDFFGNQFGSQKPIMVLQTNGGGADQPNKYSWMRDLPLGTAQHIVNNFAQVYNIVHIRREDQLQLQNTTPLQADFRALAVLIQLSEKRLLIDSFSQHTAAALGKPSVVCWIGNSPVQFGYELHTNIVANAPTVKPELRHSVYTRYNMTGQVTEFPYNNESEIFDAGAIINALINDNIEVEGQSAAATNLKLKDKIAGDSKKGSMVANRLQCLAGKVDISSIKQVLDIGSWHLGQSIEFSSVFQNAKIDAFEPVPDSYQLCVKRLDELDEQKKTRIRVHNIALSNAADDIPFYPVDPVASSTPNVGASSMFKFMDGLNGTPFGQNLVQKEIKVKANTLDSWCEEHNIPGIDIMWMDVQGAELLVLQGGEKTLSNTRIIMTEVGLQPYYQGHTLKADIDAFLTARGFSELEGSFEINVPGYEANTIYIRN